MTGVSAQFSATSSMLGYMYQCREALLLALDASKATPALALMIERFDDVTFHDGEEPVKQIQLKHHVVPGNLTDSSTDLWKTLRIWSEQVREDANLPFQRQFVIMTTATAAEDSIAAKLRPGRSEQDEADALAALRGTAESSANQQTVAARAAFLSLAIEDQRNLVAAIHVHDRSPSITDARSEIEDRLTFAAPEGQVSNLVDHLEGWWFVQIIQALAQDSAPPISLLTLRSKIDEIASAYRLGELLISVEEGGALSEDEATAETRMFVRQMRCIGLAEGAVEIAKRDFYRASAQRSAWTRENVLLDGESSRYDEALIDRWQRERLAMEDASKPASDGDKQEFGRKLFHWANRVQTPFRNRHEAWLCSGSYQILADVVALGWHPDHQSLFGPKQQDEAA